MVDGTDAGDENRYRFMKCEKGKWNRHLFIYFVSFEIGLLQINSNDLDSFNSHLKAYFLCTEKQSFVSGNHSII